MKPYWRGGYCCLEDQKWCAFGGRIFQVGLSIDGDKKRKVLSLYHLFSLMLLSWRSWVVGALPYYQWVPGGSQLLAATLQGYCTSHNRCQCQSRARYSGPKQGQEVKVSGKFPEWTKSSCGNFLHGLWLFGWDIFFMHLANSYDNKNDSSRVVFLTGTPLKITSMGKS